MNGHLNFRRRTLTLFAVLAIVLATIASGPGPRVLADTNLNPGVIPPQSRAYGHTYGEWNDAWAIWAEQVQFAPLIDTTGADCADGQSGNIWFLAGSFVGPVTRSCSVPAGKALFFPIVNGFNDTVPVVGPSPTYDDLWAPWLGPGIDAVSALSAEVDGLPLSQLFNYRATTPRPDPYSFRLLDGSGPYYGVADGYYLLLAPLNTGQHAIHFYGEIASLGVFQDVTYHLTVGP